MPSARHLLLTICCLVPTGCVRMSASVTGHDGSADRAAAAEGGVTADGKPATDQARSDAMGRSDQGHSPDKGLAVDEGHPVDKTIAVDNKVVTVDKTIAHDNKVVTVDKTIAHDLLAADKGPTPGPDKGLKADKTATPDLVGPCYAPGTGGLAITSCPITTGSLLPYTYQVVASGPGPYSWKLDSKPGGMSVSASGVISWASPTKGSHTVAVTVSNASGSATQTYTLDINGVIPNGLRPAALLGERRLPALAPRALPEGLSSLTPDLARTLAGCALPAGASVNGLEGALGLAPEWQHSPCDQRCRQRVSACVLARLNLRGERRLVELAGPDGRGLEGAFFGDLFAPRPRLLACHGTRTLARPRCLGLPGCPLEVVGRCAEICDGESCRDAEGRRYPALGARPR